MNSLIIYITTEKFIEFIINPLNYFINFRRYYYNSYYFLKCFIEIPSTVKKNKHSCVRCSVDRIDTSLSTLKVQMHSSGAQLIPSFP